MKKFAKVFGLFLIWSIIVQIFIAFLVRWDIFPKDIIGSIMVYAFIPTLVFGLIYSYVLKSKISIIHKIIISFLVPVVILGASILIALINSTETLAFALVGIIMNSVVIGSANGIALIISNNEILVNKLKK